MSACFRSKGTRSWCCCFRFPPIRSRRTEKCLELPSLPRCSQALMSDNGWGGTDQPHSNGEKNGRARTGHSSEPPLLSLAKPPRLGPSRDTAAPAPPKFSNINRATRPPFPSFSFFSLCGVHILYKHPRVAQILALRNHHGHCSVSCGPEQTYCKTGIFYQSVHREASTQGSVVVLKLDIPPIS